MENVSEKVVAITGGSSGLGAEAARHLVKAGASVVLGARRVDRLEALADELGRDQVAVRKLDVTDREDVQAFVDFAVETFGRIDVVINNAGVMPLSPKTAVRVISEGLRQEVKPYNIRTTIISPGAVDTELPASVKAPGVAEGIAAFYESAGIPASSFARCVVFAISQPDDMDVNEILFRPTAQDL